MEIFKNGRTRSKLYLQHKGAFSPLGGRNRFQGALGKGAFAADSCDEAEVTEAGFSGEVFHTDHYRRWI
jgi:hypothetical protein